MWLGISLHLLSVLKNNSRISLFYMLVVRCVLFYTNIMLIDGKHVRQRFDKNACIFNVFETFPTFHLGQLSF